MEFKSVVLSLGIGAAAGTVMGMMLPRNREMERLGRHMARSATTTAERAMDTLEQKMS